MWGSLPTSARPKPTAASGKLPRGPFRQCAGLLGVGTKVTHPAAVRFDHLRETKVGLIAFRRLESRPVEDAASPHVKIIASRSD
jgi:hypothetical protein